METAINQHYWLCRLSWHGCHWLASEWWHIDIHPLLINSKTVVQIQIITISDLRKAGLRLAEQYINSVRVFNYTYYLIRNELFMFMRVNTILYHFVQSYFSLMCSSMTSVVHEMANHKHLVFQYRYFRRTVLIFIQWNNMIIAAAMMCEVHFTLNGYQRLRKSNCQLLNSLLD